MKFKPHICINLPYRIYLIPNDLARGYELWTQKSEFEETKFIIHGILFCPYCGENLNGNK